MNEIVTTEVKQMTYEAADGSPIRLSPEIIRRYVVRGKPNLVTDQEVMWCMATCKARKLNPFTNDCYPVKYSSDDPLSIITSVDFFRKRARAAADYAGHKAGPICLTPSGELRYSRGLVMEGETVVGGWFEGKIKGLEEPYYKEVNFDAYVKTTREGKVTRFWEGLKGAEMIAKVAESQGLRQAWPDLFQGLYTEEERPEPIDITPQQITDALGPTYIQLLEQLADRMKLPSIPADLETFIAATAEANDLSTAELLKGALEDVDRFHNAYDKWRDGRDDVSDDVQGVRNGPVSNVSAPPAPAPPAEDAPKSGQQQGQTAASGVQDKNPPKDDREPERPAETNRGGLTAGTTIWPPHTHDMDPAKDYPKQYGYFEDRESSLPDDVVCTRATWEKIRKICDDQNLSRPDVIRDHTVPCNVNGTLNHYAFQKHLPQARAEKILAKLEADASAFGPPSAPPVTGQREPLTRYQVNAMEAAMERNKIGVTFVEDEIERRGWGFRAVHKLSKDQADIIIAWVEDQK